MEVRYKFSPGDKVILKSLDSLSWNQMNYHANRKEYTPQTYTIDGYGYSIDKDGNHMKYYLLHAYCDKWVNYHARFTEDVFEAVDESHEMVHNVEFVDCFGNQLSIGDVVYNDMYCKKYGNTQPVIEIMHNGPTIMQLTSMNWINEFPTKGFIDSNKVRVEYRGSHIYPTVDINSYEYMDSRKYGAVNTCCPYNVIKADCVPATVIEDYVSEMNSLLSRLSTEYDKFIWTSWLKEIGIYDELMTRINEIKKSGKKVRKPKKKSPTRVKKTKDVDTKISEMIANMSDDEKAKMLEMLNKNHNDYVKRLR